MAFKKKTKDIKEKPKPSPNVKPKMTKKQIINTICIILLSGVLICSVVGFSVLQGILNGSQLISGINGLEAENSSRIYDKDGKLITTLSGESGVRENIKYSQVPQVVIDAFLSIEDSRFYKHNGFDLPRFISSGFNNIKTGGLNQGGSTLTMQLVDVALFSEEDKANAGTAQKIEQKVQEIFKSMEIEGELSKEKVMENYLNLINFGGAARGIQKGAQYYFGKNVEQLNLSEAAFLAGVINAPGAYNPYLGTVDNGNGTTTDHYELALERRNEVLNMMKYHGYLSDEEYQLAKSSELSFQLNGIKNFDTEAYKSFVDLVVQEVKDKTGDNPYTTPMDIYTTMDRSLQETSDNLCNGDGITYPDERYQTGFATVNNQTGEILALGGGRSYNGDRNRAAVDKHNPGSTAKPIVDYAEAFEYLGYSTEHVIEDGPVSNYTSSGTLWNADRQFRGDVTLKEAIGMSLNVPAFKTFADVVDKIGKDKEIEILNNMGIDIDSDSFSYSISIGGGELTVTPLEMAGAYSVFANKGNYIEPYSVKKIKYQDSKKETYKADPTPQKVFSEETAFLTSYMLKDVVEGGYGMLADILRDNYTVYAKTGTTDFDSETAAYYGYPDGVAKEKYMVAYTDKYTIACWSGYDEAVKGQANYLDETKLYWNVEGNVINTLLDQAVAKDGGAGQIAQPSGVVSITHIQGLFPYATASNNGALMVTGLINKKFAKGLDTVSPDSLEAPASISVKDNGDGTITISMPLYPDEKKRTVASGTKTMSGGGVTVSGKCIFDKSFLFGAVSGKVNISIDGKSIGTFDMNGTTLTKSIDVSSGQKITVSGYYTYSNADVKSSAKEASVNATSSKTNSYTIGTDFTSIFTDNYEDSKAAVIDYMSANLKDVTYTIAQSTAVGSGQLDPASTIYAGAVVKDDGTKYTIIIGK